TGRAVRVTQAGLDRGARVSRNHALWEQYLVSYADVAPSHVDWSVDQVEHVLSEELVSRLEARLRERGIETAVQPHATGAVP
ncbi:MAG: iron dependent repressor, metal binding and dimerization domain protein, partial [Planctomycetota bacterium]